MKTKKFFFLMLGTAFLSTGAVGLIIPVLPTTPFILAAFFCFTKSSKKAEQWIMKNRYFRSYIENYKNKKGVPLDIKIKSILFLWISLLGSLLFFNQKNLYIMLILVGIAVTVHIFLLKTKK
ncbi:MAG: YbaN family protein [Methanobacteriaceae archaeon]|nr:YbaN family protein [Methanobacteriaceae archaeon]MDO9626230.1 YbaN family protein [Methanobacteriaceae archaeon]